MNTQNLSIRKLVLSAAIGLIFLLIGCATPQQILLIGTFHSTQPSRKSDVIPIANALKKFHPQVICVEFPEPRDTVSLRHMFGDSIFCIAAEKRKVWNVDEKDIRNIQTVQKYLEQHPSDVTKRMQFQQELFLTHNIANAEYQGYLSFNNNDSTRSKPQKKLEDYELLLSMYERHKARNSEYFLLVFPLAKDLGITYLHPIDDLTTWKQYEYHWNQMQIRDSSDSISIRYHRQKGRLSAWIGSAPAENNLWVTVNTPVFTNDLLFREGYFIEDDSVNQNFKMRHRYWVQRNKVMAQHIDEVAHKNPKKRVVVFFGVSHVGAVREELKKIKGKREILTLIDILPNIDSIANFSPSDHNLLRRHQ